MYYETIQTYIKFREYWSEDVKRLFYELELDNKPDIGIYRKKWKIFNEYIKIKIMIKN